MEGAETIVRGSEGAWRDRATTPGRLRIASGKKEWQQVGARIGQNNKNKNKTKNKHENKNKNNNKNRSKNTNKNKNKHKNTNNNERKNANTHNKPTHKQTNNTTGNTFVYLVAAGSSLFGKMIDMINTGECCLPRAS